MGEGNSGRTVLVVSHTGRRDSLRSARLVADLLAGAGMTVRVLASEAADIGCERAHQVTIGPHAAEGVEVVIVVGGDGTLLRAAELARPAGAPLLGVNLGHVGFLAAAEPDGLTETVQRVVDRKYTVEQRMTVDVAVWQDGTLLARTWALNEATVEKAARERMVEVVVGIDGRPLSRWGCDGVVCATPTGSTAYAFSAGGPVVWPEVEALLLVPISAHALFARPMVVSPDSVLAVEVLGGTSRGPRRPTPGLGEATPAPEPVALPGTPSSPTSDAVGAVLWCDSRRRVDLTPGARVEVRRGTLPVLLARLAGSTPGDDRRSPTADGARFADRLVAKFGLPVAGWRGGRRGDTDLVADGGDGDLTGRRPNGSPAGEGAAEQHA